MVVLDREDDGSVEIEPCEGFGGPQPTIILSRRDEPDAELERLLKLGARPADIGQTGQGQWHVLIDPEGNEFCLLKARLGPTLMLVGPASTSGPVLRPSDRRHGRRRRLRAHVGDELRPCRISRAGGP